MNLLPFVVVIVLILGMFSHSLFERTNSLEKERNAYTAYFKGLRKARNYLEETAYIKSKKRPQEPTLPKGNGPKKNRDEGLRQLPFFRERKIGWPQGKLQLSSLLKESHPYLEAVASSYIEALYNKASFFPKDHKFSHRLLQSLIQAQKKSETLLPLHELAIEEQEIFYKMLRGTQTYDIKNHIGYPPFEDFFTFENLAEAPMNFHFANELFLSVVFGDEVAEVITNKEKVLLIDQPRKQTSPIVSISKLNLLIGEQFSIREINWQHLFHFTPTDGAKNPETYVDKKTNITVRVE